MRPRERRESGKQDLFRSRLDQIIDMNHALVKLARTIDWRFLEEKFGAVYTDKPGQPPLPTRLMAGLAILKHTYDLSDEALCDRWVENPYFQYFCGEDVRPLYLARRVLEQERRQRGRKVYSLHAPEVECIGKGKPHRPYEFGVKVSVATTVRHSAGGQFVTHAAALPGNSYDGHTLGTVIPQIQALIGNILDRCITDAGYRGHNAPPDYKFKVYTTGQKRRLTPQIKREFKRRAAIEPVIGHLTEHHRMRRNHLAHASGDAINAVLAATGYNFRRLLAWLRFLLLTILIALGLAA